MKAYYYREYVSNEGLLLQRVRLQWKLAITDSKSPMMAYYYREYVSNEGLLLQRVSLPVKAYYYRE